MRSRRPLPPGGDSKGRAALWCETSTCHLSAISYKFTMSTYDFIVVGGGIAGSILTWELLQHKVRVLLIDDTTKPKASQVAAGLITPITGRRLSKSWSLEQSLPYAINFYNTLETQLPSQNLPPSTPKIKLFHPRSFVRILQNQNEVEIIEKRLRDPEYQPYLHSSITQPNTWNPNIHSPYGTIEFKHTGYLDIPTLLQSLHNLFQSKNCLLNTWININDIKIEKNICTWNNLQTPHIILCEGSLGKFNTRFTQKPILDPVKGEILTLEGQLPTPLNNYILNYGNWALPIPELNIVKIGATFDREDVDNLTPSQTVQSSLLNNFQKIFTHIPHFKIKQHLVGQRACTRDNLPLLGTFPHDPTITIFNGLGAKASLYAPYWAHHLTQHLIHNTSIDKAIHIERLLKW
jgi:glycine/D-amino acid oxidase-like deaminating enzyme